MLLLPVMSVLEQWRTNEQLWHLSGTEKNDQTFVWYSPVVTGPIGGFVAQPMWQVSMFVDQVVSAKIFAVDSEKEQT